MNLLKRGIAFATVLAMFCSPSFVSAQNCYMSSTGGCGYVECRRAPCITPAVALGTIALVAIIAVAVQNSQAPNSHSHAHSSNSNSCGCNCN